MIHNLYTCLILLIQLWAIKIDITFISVKFGVEKKWIIYSSLVAGVANFCGYIIISSLFQFRHSILVTRENWSLQGVSVSQSSTGKE